MRHFQNLRGPGTLIKEGNTCYRAAHTGGTKHAVDAPKGGMKHLGEVKRGTVYRACKLIDNLKSGRFALCITQQQLILITLAEDTLRSIAHYSEEGNKQEEEAGYNACPQKLVGDIYLFA